MAPNLDLTKHGRYFLLVVFSFFSLLAWGQKKETYLFSRQYQQMGTSWQIKAYLSTEDSVYADQLSVSVKELLDSLNTIFSDYNPASELNQAVAEANRHPVSLSLPLWEVLQEAQTYSRQSKGAFDISIGPLSRLWRRAFRRQVFPEREAIKSAQHKVNYRWIKLKNQQLRLKREGMRLDLGGIAKGKTIDYIAEYFLACGITVFLIDGGGDIRVQGQPPGATSWQVELPNGQIKAMTEGAIATSGATYRYLEYKGKRYSHLIDPRSGYGVSYQGVVTVIAPTATEADAMASAFSVLNEKQGNRLRKKLKGRVLVYYFLN
jgi:thiamine biosynthesis lipoprotein